MNGRDRGGDQRLRTAFYRLRAALRDPTTGLFSYPYYFDRVRMMLSDRPAVGVVWIGMGERRMIESVYGWETYDAVLAEVARGLTSAVGELIPEESVVAMAGVHADAFVLFVPATLGGESIDADLLDLVVHGLLEQANEALRKQGDLADAEHGDLRAGTALLRDHPFQRFERCLHQSLDRARAIAERPHETERLSWMAELQRLLRDRAIRTVFQPIVDLQSGQVRAHEAFARGPERSVFKLPRVMFSVGVDAGLASDLDRACRHGAIREASRLAGRASRTLFLNTLPSSLADPEWTSARMLELLEAQDLAPGDIVIELAEAELGDDLQIYARLLQPLRDQGYRFSLDDAGSGQRTSAVVETLRPEFLKVDVHLIRGLEHDAFRRELVATLAHLARRAGALLVAERIESQAEREALVEAGARWGQGALFGSEAQGADAQEFQRDIARGEGP